MTRTLTANITPFGLRLQPALKTRLEAAAQTNERSLNSEIANRLEESLQPRVSGAQVMMDAIEDDVLPRARIVARFGLAAADNAEARDVVILDKTLSDRIEANIGAGKSIHDAARSAIELAFPVEQPSWSQIASELRKLDLANSPHLEGLLSKLQGQSAKFEEPTK